MKRIKKGLKATGKFIKDFIWLVKNVRELERDVENLENKVLAPEKVRTNRGFSYYFDLIPSMFEWGDSRTITLEEKVEALATLLDINFTLTDTKDEEVVATFNKKRRKKK